MNFPAVGGGVEVEVEVESEKIYGLK